MEATVGTEYLAGHPGQGGSWGSWVVRRQYRHSGYADAGEQAALDFAAPVIRGGSVLDIGVGGGRTTDLLEPASERYVGVDFDERMIKSARTKRPHVDYQVVDARDLSCFVSADFDAAMFSFNGLDLVGRGHRSGVLSEVSRVLRPGGTFIASTLNLDGISFRETPLVRRPRPVVELNTGLIRTTTSAIRRGVRKLALPVEMYNFAKSAAHIQWGTDWAEWPLQVHEFRFIAHFTTLGGLVRELGDAGFDIEGLWDTSGAPLDPYQLHCDADYIHFVCRSRS
ncbi:class I SAM-dependent methyltransferase [Geodermatophilus sp. SYSU D00804]